jgi:hypothetical protein
MAPRSVATAKAMLEQRLRGTEVVEAPDYLRWAQDEVYIEDPHKIGNTVIDFKPWKMQLEYMECIHIHKQTITLKARQLGVSWCVIVYCVWLAIFHQNVQILVFSKDLEAAKEIIRRVRFIFKHLRNKPVMEKGRGDNQQAVLFSNGSRFKAFPATKNAGTSFTATFLIVDEADKMEFGAELYTSIKPTIDDGGRVAIIFTAFEESGMGRMVWKKAGFANEGASIVKFFMPWWARPGRTQEWYNRVASEAISVAHHRQEYPATPEEALHFTNLDSRFVQGEELWNALRMAEPLLSSQACVLSLDAGVSSDNFAMVSACWHPTLGFPAIRDSKVWVPPKTQTGQLDLNEVYDEIKKYINTHRILRVVYDPYQMVAFGQTLQKTGKAREFGQGAERMAADTLMRRRIMQGEFRHNGDETLGQHFLGADFKLDSNLVKLRMIKRGDNKIDLAVASSMAVYELVNEFPFNSIPNVGVVSKVSDAANNLRQLKKAFDGLPQMLYNRMRRG